MSANLELVRPASAAPDHILRATPETVHWGYFSPALEPVLTIRSGDIVQIDTVSQVGFSAEDPAGSAARYELPITGSVEELVRIMSQVPREGVHVLTGPIYVEDARPGDMLEIRFHDISVRPPFYGVNVSNRQFGALPHLVSEDGWTKIFHFDMERGVIPFNERIEVPLAPFMGIVGVAPAERVSSIPPGRHGGNIDLKELVGGTSLFLPVLVEGGLFSAGDGHAAQGDGEVNLTAVESSLTIMAQFILHKDSPMNFPRAETASHFISMGLDADLNRAAEYAIEEAIGFLSSRFGLSTMEAYSLVSIAIDLEVTQVVDQVKGIHAMIPKSLFLDRQDDFWAAGR